MELHPPKNLWEFRKLQGIYAYIQSFILNLSGRCRPFSGLMNKGLDFWIGWVMPKCARKYQIISHKTPNFSQLNKKGNPSYCTLRPWQSLGAVFGTREHHTENNILFKSNLRRYSLTGKVCLTLIFAIQKLQHYLQYYSIKLISKANPFYPKSDDSKWSICKMGSIWFRVLTPRSHKRRNICRLLCGSSVLDDSPLAINFLDEDVPIIEVQIGCNVFWWSFQ